MFAGLDTAVANEVVVLVGVASDWTERHCCYCTLHQVGHDLTLVQSSEKINRMIDVRCIKGRPNIACLIDSFNYSVLQRRVSRSGTAIA